MSKKVIKFWAGYCGPCNQYAPTFEKIKEELQSDEIEFVNVNVEEDTEGLAADYSVRSIPYTVLLENGVQIKNQVGLIDELKLRQFILN